MKSISQIKSKIYYFFKRLDSEIFYAFHRKPKILDNYKTIDKIINDGFSISRFGDGEFDLLTKRNEFKFQKSNDLLSKRLSEILISKNNHNILIGIPMVFNKRDLEFRTDESKLWWSKYMLNYRKEWYKYLDLNQVYANANFTRNYIAAKDKSKCREYYKYIKKIWNSKEIVIVEGEFSRFGVGNDLLNNSRNIERILCPSENAFDKYESIFNEIKKNITKDKLILIALGPTATVLAYDLAKIGYQAIDIGHLDIEYEWFLRECDKKIKIENKYTFESGNFEIHDEYDDIIYKEQIKMIIS